ncbi:MAG: hypothetical protein QOE82_3029 [Thermoanaerobaculia bacterium]|nr:hypothetical protein [Thermoanaerobaculia bacterium]
MTFVKQPFALACIAVAAAAFSASAQTPELNPTVKVLARPQSPVPVECATDQSTVPALEAEASALEPSAADVPPSNDLRASMRRLQVAAEGDDYTAFKSAYAEAKRAIAAHPPGGERTAANDAMQVFNDLARIWDYAMATPTGAFFDSTVQSGSLLNAMKRYPTYGSTIADETYTSGGRTLYPTRETRRFLARESSRRLSRLGVSTPTRVARGEQPAPAPRRVVTPPPPTPKPVQVTTKPAKTKTPPKTAQATTPAPKKKTTTAQATTAAPKKSPTKTTQAAASSKPVETKPKPAPVKTAAKATPPKTKEPEIKATPLPTPKPVPPPVKVAEKTPIAPGPSIVNTATVAPPVTTSSAATTTTAPPPVTTSSATPPTTTTAAPATDTTTDTSVTAAPDTTGTAPPAEKQNGNMNLIWAVVLILVGIGVLIVLIRASD